eukprot:855135-Pelagomonas_calceolata.AAC.2
MKRSLATHVKSTCRYEAPQPPAVSSLVCAHQPPMHMFMRRYEARRPPAVSAARAAKGLPVEPSGSSLARFDLEIDWIKALPMDPVGQRSAKCILGVDCEHWQVATPSSLNLALNVPLVNARKS